MSHLQTNGQAKSANKEIFDGLKKKIEGEKGTRDEELSSILWASCTTIKYATDHTPFSLVYGFEAVLPVEIGIHSNRGNVDLRLIAYKQRITRYFNRHVKTRHLQIRDFALRKVEGTGKVTKKASLS